MALYLKCILFTDSIDRNIIHMTLYVIIFMISTNIVTPSYMGDTLQSLTSYIIIVFIF